MRFQIFKNDITFTSIFDGEADSIHHCNKVIWISYCITGVIQVCVEPTCTIEKIEADGTIWLTGKEV